jgi:putative nucleotidyltransferase with HDIG domain
LNVILSDRTGQVKGVVWDQVERIVAAVSEGDFVHVRAQVSEYRGSLQLVVKDMARVPAEQVDAEDFLAATTRDVTKMLDRLKEMTGRMQTPHLKALFEAFWADDAFVAAYVRAPAAKLMHHAYIGGLLEHTLSMAVLSEMIAGHYSGVDRDLLLAGVILHDVGKTRELEYTRRIDYTDEGRLLSHIIIGLSMLDEKLKQVPDFPDVQAQLLKHMIVSHHGDPGVRLPRAAQNHRGGPAQLYRRNGFPGQQHPRICGQGPVGRLVDALSPAAGAPFLQRSRGKRWFGRLKRQAFPGMTLVPIQTANQGWDGYPYKIIDNIP